MCATILKFMYLQFILQLCCVVSIEASQPNKTHHARKETVDNLFFKNQKLPSYRSFQPVSIKYHKTVYPKSDDRVDYDITSYDTEYGGVVSNFTSSIYDDNPPLYPNPEILTRSNQVMLPVVTKTIDTRIMEIPDPDIPDDSLADADLKEHNIIDSVTYLYGYNNNCHGVRTEWLILIFIGSGISIALLSSTIVWLMWSERAKQYRDSSKLYPLVINLCCCLQACTLIYIQAIMGVSSPSQCEKIALLLHYTHLTCSMWVVLIAGSVTEYSTTNTVMSLKYHYLLAYGVPAVVVMFNYALSMEHYEIKYYCWMSIEKGMVMGFMVPAMVLILINTGIVILGLQSVNKKQSEIMTAKIQEFVDHHIDNWPKGEGNEDPKEGSVDTLNIYSPRSSRKNTDSSDTLDRDLRDYDEENHSHYVNIELLNENVGNNETTNQPAPPSDDRANQNLLNILYLENLSWKSTLNSDTQQLKTYLNLCLVTEPFFAVNWVMGVVAVENATYWPSPALYLILLQAMYIYLTATLCTSFPIIRNEKHIIEHCCEQVIAEPTLTRARTTDSIPLLDPSIQQPNVTPAPADTISTISI